MPHSYTLYECPSCRSRLFDWEELPVDLREFYNDAPLPDHQSQAAPFTKTAYWSHEVQTIQRLHRGAPQRVLDIGCGTGDFLLHWPDNTARVGVELSAGRASVASSRGLTVIQDFLENVEFDDGFDVVAAYAILEHLRQPCEVLSTIAGLVRNGGVLVIMIPSYQTMKAALLAALGRRWHMYEPPEHLNLYSRKFLDAYLQDQGFCLRRRVYTSGGMFNPFQKVPVLNRAFAKSMGYVDALSPSNRLPLFDHMYSYYVKP